MVETSMLRMEGRSEDALTHAAEAVACAERFANDDLLAMSLHVEGLLLLDAVGSPTGSRAWTRRWP